MQQTYSPPTPAQIRRDAKDLFDDPEPWLRTPNEQLGGRTPNEVMASGENGRERVRDLLEAIKLGITT